MTTLHHKVQSCQEKEIGQSSMLSLLILTSFQTPSSTSNKQSYWPFTPPCLRHSHPVVSGVPPLAPPSEPWTVMPRPRVPPMELNKIPNRTEDEKKIRTFPRFYQLTWFLLLLLTRMDRNIR